MQHQEPAPYQSAADRLFAELQEAESHLRDDAATLRSQVMSHWSEYTSERSAVEGSMKLLKARGIDALADRLAKIRSNAQPIYDDKSYQAAFYYLQDKSREIRSEVVTALATYPI